VRCAQLLALVPDAVPSPLPEAPASPLVEDDEPDWSPALDPDVVLVSPPDDPVAALESADPDPAP